MNSSSILEAQLCGQMADQRRYARALALVTPLPVSLEKKANVEDTLQRLAEILAEAAAASASISEAHQRLLAVTSTPSLRIQQEKTRLKDTLKQLIETVDRSTSIAQKAKDRLLPQVGNAVQAQRMRAAYSATR